MSLSSICLGLFVFLFFLTGGRREDRKEVYFFQDKKEKFDFLPLMPIKNTF
jgi:hypothetical protein